MNFDLKMVSRWMLPLLLLGLSQWASAENEAVAAGGDSALFAQYPAGSIRTVDGANAALAATSAERARIDVEWIRQQRVCYARFLVSSCLEKIKTAHRDESKRIKNIEVEANTYLRQVRADDRDTALAEQRAQELADAPRRAEEQKKNAAENARKVEESAQRSAEADARAKTPAITPEERIARHEQNMQAVRARQEADAKKHAENVAAFEKKARDAEARQKEIADKKAAKAKEIADRAAQPK